MFETTNWPDTSMHQKGCTKNNIFALNIASFVNPSKLIGNPQNWVRKSLEMWFSLFTTAIFRFPSPHQPSIPKQRYIQQQKLPEIRRN